MRVLRMLQRLGHRIGSSIWFIPFVIIPLELIAVRVVHELDDQVSWTLLGLDASGAKAMYDAIIAANLSFLVFTFGSLLVAVQVASAQLTPRIIATTLLSDRTIKYCVGLFIFTLLFSISTQNRVGADVQQLPAFVAAALGIVCFASFFFLIDHASRLLRPVSVLSHVGNRGLEVLAAVYPERSHDAVTPKSAREALGEPNTIIAHREKSGIVLSVDTPALMAEAERIDVVIEFAPQVGDFVAVDEDLFLIYGRGAIDESKLRGAVEFGSERTMEQDPTFAFRIVVDIALRALSTAINDPTTAVLAIDQLHRLLRSAGMKHLHTDELRDKNGRLRAIVRTPNWEDLVHLSFREIRRCGSDNLQVVRRLRAMFDNLLRTLPAHRLPAIALELTLLDREIEQKFPYPEDLALAQIGDPQGLGGRSGVAT
jgi:uncharacterized membrane protein